MDDNIVYEAKNGSLGINLIKKIRPEIVVVDINAPKVDAIGVVEYLKNVEFNTQIIVVGIKKRIKRYRDELKNNVAYCIEKPVNLNYFSKIFKHVYKEAKKNTGKKKKSMEKYYTNVVMGTQGCKVCKKDDKKQEAYIVSVAIVYEKKEYNKVNDNIYTIIDKIQNYISRFDGNYIVFKNMKIDNEINIICENSNYQESIFVDIIKKIRKETGIRLYIGVGEKNYLEGDLEFSYLQSKRALLNCALVKENGICHIREIKCKMKKYCLNKKLLEEYICFVEEGNRKKANNINKLIFEEIKACKDFSPESLRQAFILIVAELSKLLMKYGTFFEEISGHKNISGYILEEIIIINELENEIEYVTKNIIDYIKSQKKKDKPTEVYSTT